MFVIVKSTPENDHRFASAVFQRGEAPVLDPVVLARKTTMILQPNQPDSGWQTDGEHGRNLFDKLSTGKNTLGALVGGRIYRGIVTGLNEAFYLDQATRDELVRDDPNCAAVIKPILRGEDLRPWYQENENRWLIFARRGINIDEYPSIKEHLSKFKARLQPRPQDWPTSKSWPGRKPGRYQWYELQDTVDYFPEFEGPKILWPDITKIPRFSWDEAGQYMNDLGFIIPTSDLSLLAFLQSRVAWSLISRICLHNKFRAGLWEYRLKAQFLSRLPVPEMSVGNRTAISVLGLGITERARARHTLHRKTRDQIQRDLGTPDKGLNQKLRAWWDLDFSTLRVEIQKVYKRDIPVKERSEWDEWLTEQRKEHQRLTGEIIALETELNDRVYRLFDLAPDEIRLIEETTKYSYGEV